MSSTGSNIGSFNRAIKDFKKALGERKTPKNLLFLNRLIMVIVSTTIVLSSIDFGILKHDVSLLQQKSELIIMSEQRALKLV